jgi:hypothetical protein
MLRFGVLLFRASRLWVDAAVPLAVLVLDPCYMDGLGRRDRRADCHYFAVVPSLFENRVTWEIHL